MKIGKRVIVEQFNPRLDVVTNATIYEGDEIVAFIVNMNKTRPHDIHIEQIRENLSPGWSAFPHSARERVEWAFFGVVHRSDIPRKKFEVMNVRLP